jgi:hypothetical protein
VGYNQAGPDEQEVMTKLSIEFVSVICDAHADILELFYGTLK